MVVDTIEYEDMTSNFGIKGNKGLAIFNVHNGDIFPYGDMVAAKDVETFITQVSTGKIEAWNGNELK